MARLMPFNYYLKYFKTRFDCINASHDFLLFEWPFATSWIINPSIIFSTLFSRICDLYCGGSHQILTLLVHVQGREIF